MGEWARDSVTSSYGAAGHGFLQLAGAKCQGVLRESIAAFTAQSTLPPIRVADHLPIHLGGNYVNDLVIAAPVYLEDEGAWRPILSGAAAAAIEPEGVTATYVVQRRLDTGVSALIGAPAVTYSEGIIVIGHSREPRKGVRVLLIDKQGVRLDLAIDEVAPGRRVPFPDRRNRFHAYADALVGWAGGQKVYVLIVGRDGVVPPAAAGEIIAPFRASRWERLTLGEPTASRPADTDPPDGAARILGSGTVFLQPQGGEGGGGWDGPDDNGAPGGGPGAGGTYNSGSTVLVGTSGIVGIGQTVEGPGGQTGYGPDSSAGVGYEQCTHYNSRDECKNCCLTTFTWGVSTVVGMAIACHAASGFWCPPCHFACGVVEGAALTILYLAKDDCQRNCERAVSW